MSLCINPNCQHPNNPDSNLFCVSCGSELLLDGQYRVLKQLGGGGFGVTYESIDDQGVNKVLKVLTLDNPEALRLFKKEYEV
ncbi:MAG: serine/threonine protein kinase, partial [Moorea sp. SIO2B7]|nr:serine/threonine protein kinase [Moorena sp. SIO2B7]